MGLIETFLIHIGGRCATTMKQNRLLLASIAVGGRTNMRDARYIDIPGTRTHELPPLLVHASIEHTPAEDIDSVLGEADDMLSISGASPDVLEQRRFELALQL